MLVLLSRLDNLWLDTWMAGTASGKPSQDTIVAHVDEIRVSAVGQRPWPRYRIASLIERGSEAGASSIALDFVFPEDDRSSLKSVMGASRHWTASEQAPRADRALRTALSRTVYITILVYRV